MHPPVTVETRRHAPPSARSAKRTGAALQRFGSPRIWFAAASVFLVFAAAFFVSSAPFSIPSAEAACGQTPLDMRFAPTGGEVTAFLDSCGAIGRDAYRNLQKADLIYPVVVALFMASSLAIVMGRLFPHRRWAVALIAIPIVASGFDYLENLFAWLALSAYPEPASTNSLFGVASAAKNIASWSAGLLLLTGIAALAVRAAWRRVHHVA